MTAQPETPKGGCISAGLTLFAGLCGLITLISVFNVAFDLEWGIRVYGSRTDLPTDWMSVIALGVISLITLGISALISNPWVLRQYKARPWLKWVTPLVIMIGLSVGFYAVYYSIEYAGPLHYATRDNDMETVKELLQEGVDDRDFRYAVDECIELDHSAILAVLLAQPKAEKTMKQDFVYALEMGSKDIIIAFIEAGVGPDGESGDFLAQFLAVSDLSAAEKETVGLKFLKIGASPYGLYTGGYMGTDLTALEQAKEQGLTKLVAAMEAE